MFSSSSSVVIVTCSGLSSDMSGEGIDLRLNEGVLNVEMDRFV